MCISEEKMLLRDDIYLGICKKNTHPFACEIFVTLLSLKTPSSLREAEFTIQDKIVLLLSKKAFGL